jgi:hypothetical protein
VNKFQICNIPIFNKGNKIKIKKKNRGKFTEYCGGEVTQKCINRAKKSKNPTLRKRATFAENSRKWKHQEGGVLQDNTLLKQPLIQPKLYKSEWYSSMASKNYTPMKLKDGTYAFEDDKGNVYYNNGRIKYSDGRMANYNYNNIPKLTKLTLNNLAEGFVERP